MTLNRTLKPKELHLETTSIYEGQSNCTAVQAPLTAPSNVAVMIPFLLGMHWSRSCLLKFSLWVQALSVRAAAGFQQTQQKPQLCIRTAWDTMEASVTKRFLKQKKKSFTAAY